MCAIFIFHITVKKSSNFTFHYFTPEHNEKIIPATSHLNFTNTLSLSKINERFFMKLRSNLKHAIVNVQ